MRREFQLWTLDSQWRNVRNLFADKNFNFIPWFWLQSQSQWGWGESWVSSLYLPPHYGHNNVTRLRSPSKSGDRFNVTGMRLQFFWFHEMLFDELWSSNWHLGNTLPKETRTEFTIPEQSRKWPILRGFYWAVNEASGPEIKYQPAFYYWARVTNMWWVRNQVWDVRRMSGWRVITGHYVNWDWQQHNI